MGSRSELRTRRRFLSEVGALAAAGWVAGSADGQAPAEYVGVRKNVWTGETGVSRFPREFWWGVATAAYQVEGAWNAGGKGESVWDHFTHTPSMIKCGMTGDVACDSYHRYEQDAAMMESLGVRSYRFSVSWPRVRPGGRGAFNPEGLAYYDKLVDVICRQGIRPVCTLFHWDLPQELAGQAWRSRETVSLFGEYAAKVAQVLGDRVQVWAVLNEPAVFARGAYGLPLDAPEKTSFTEALKSQHGANLATGEAFRAVKAERSAAQVGNALSMSPIGPATPSDEDKAAAERYHAWLNQWFLEPSLHGRYPDAFVGGAPLDEMGFRPGDEEKLKAPLDWIGINYYNRLVARHRDVSKDSKGEARVGATTTRGYEGPLTSKGWEVWPKGIYDITTRISRDYGLPIEITENGCGYDDAPDLTGAVHDPQRIEFYRAHLNELARAINDGAKVRGFHAWSLMDNFEWADGYTQRFGLVYVERPSLGRIVKSSGQWYSRVIAEHALNGA